MTRSRIDIKPFRVPPGSRFSLANHDPADTGTFETRQGTRKLLAKQVHRLFELADLLYAQSRWSVLFVFQAMDGAGKDSAIKHVMRGLDPKATQVYSFKTPSQEELKHDFMWRCLKNLPERGRIGIFNRSHYEEVVTLKVHPDWLEKQHLPAGERGKSFWDGVAGADKSGPNFAAGELTYLVDSDNNAGDFSIAAPSGSRAGAAAGLVRNLASSPRRGAALCDAPRSTSMKGMRAVLSTVTP